MSLCVREEQFENYGRVLYISNGVQEMRVTLDIGPRVISYNLVGYPNMFCTDLERIGSMSDENFKTIYGDKTWYLYGGHRFWISPEGYETYYPDNDPVSYTQKGNVFRFTPPTQKVRGLLCELEITFDEKEAKADVMHILTNKSGSVRQGAIWAITVTAKGGRAIQKQCCDKTKFRHNRMITFWDYVDLSDERFYADKEYYALQQKEGFENPFKFGTNNTHGSIITVNNGCVFKKEFDYLSDYNYPDSGMTTETYTNFFMLEVETLSPLYTLCNGDVRKHTEHWSLIPEKSTNLEDVVKYL